MSDASGNERVLRILQARGSEGTHQGEWKDKGDVIDGQKAITRLAARIRDLRDQGHPIVEIGRTPGGFKRYALAQEGELVPAWLVFDPFCLSCHARQAPNHDATCDDCGGPVGQLRVRWVAQARRRAA